jgi:transposase InsO family protein
MHGNARLAPKGRLMMVSRVLAGRPKAHVAAEMGVSRATVSKWCKRFELDGVAGLADRSSRPHSSPSRTSPEVEALIAELRRDAKLGPARIGYRLGIPASTVHRVLVRLGLNRLAWMDRPTGRVIRRYERPSAGDLVHVDIKKLGRIPIGGGWRAHGREARPRNFKAKTEGVGFAYLHAAVDDHSRLAYVEAHRDETKDTCAAFWGRAVRFFAGYDITVDQVLTDNGPGYRSKAFADALGAVQHLRTRPYRPQTNGKVERFNRTLLEEWAYVQVYDSEAERLAALEDFLHCYNHHRRHTSLGGLTPIDRVNNVSGQYS